MIDINKPFKFWCPADRERIDYTWDPCTETISWNEDGREDSLEISKEKFQNCVDGYNWCVVIAEEIN